MQCESCKLISSKNCKFMKFRVAAVQNEGGVQSEAEASKKEIFHIDHM